MTCYCCLLVRFLSSPAAATARSTAPQDCCVPRICSSWTVQCTVVAPLPLVPKKMLEPAHPLPRWPCVPGVTRYAAAGGRQVACFSVSPNCGRLTHLRSQSAMGKRWARREHGILPCLRRPGYVGRDGSIHGAFSGPLPPPVFDAARIAVVGSR